MMKLAVGRGIAPEAFWRLSVREWLWLTTASDVRFGVTELEALMEAYPDG
jgi:uncharacterized phage protein (TIGR02216 family)